MFIFKNVLTLLLMSISLWALGLCIYDENIPSILVFGMTTAGFEERFSKVHIF